MQTEDKKPVIDVDSHVEEPQEAWSYLAAQIAAGVVRIPHHVVGSKSQASGTGIGIRQRVFRDLHGHGIDAAHSVTAEIDVPRHAL